jgi:hypothetical protein
VHGQAHGPNPLRVLSPFPFATATYGTSHRSAQSLGEQEHSRGTRNLGLRPRFQVRDPAQTKLNPFVPLTLSTMLFLLLHAHTFEGTKTVERGYFRKLLLQAEVNASVVEWSTPPTHLPCSSSSDLAPSSSRIWLRMVWIALMLCLLR